MEERNRKLKDGAIQVPAWCGDVGEIRNGMVTVFCQRPPGHPGKHAGMGREWNDDAGAKPPSQANPSSNWRPPDV